MNLEVADFWSNFFKTPQSAPYHQECYFCLNEKIDRKTRHEPLKESGCFRPKWLDHLNTIFYVIKMETDFLTPQQKKVGGRKKDRKGEPTENN